MSKHFSTEVLPDNLQDHRAVKAWRQIHPECFEPRSIEVLKLERKKSAVYRLTGVGLNGLALIAKRCLTETATIERVVYERLLPRLSMPVLTYYGFVPEPEGDFCWLFIADAGAHEYSLESADHRALAGRWLGTVHNCSRLSDAQALLPDRGPSYYLQLLRSTRTELLARVGNPVLSADEVALLQMVAAHCDVIEAHWAEVERLCEGLPRTLVHGDFVIKNLRVQTGTPGPALLVYDWEMAGWGMPATDLAQIERSARPDLDAYYSVLRQDFPQLELRDVQRLAEYGNLLRLMDEIFWETVSMEGDSYKNLLKPLRSVRKYELRLDAALRAINWN